MPSSETVAKVKKYMEQLNREDKIRHALSRLEKIDMTLDLLQKTQVGKAVNQLCRHNIYGDDALRIVTRWKEIARRNGIMPVKQEDPSSSEDEQKPQSDEESPPRASKRYTPSPEVYGRKVPKKEVEDDTYSSLPSSSSTSIHSIGASYKEEKPFVNYKVIRKEEDSFSRSLAKAMEVTPPKTKRPKIMDLDDINLNYRPLPSLSAKTHVAKPAEEKFNPEQMFRPRNDRGKVFAGRKKGSGLTEVPRLFDSCLRVLSNNIGAGVLDDIGDIPFFVLEPVLEKCTWKQLERIESRNPHLEEDSDKLWEKLFTKHHVGKKKSKKESYKDAFFRLNEENDAKFKALSDRIKKVNKSEEMQTHKTEMISEAYAPLNVRRKQAKHGTAYGNRALPTASEISKARKEIFDKGSSKSLSTIPSAVINRFSTVGSKKESAAKPQPPKKGALMVKTLKMLNMKRR